MDYLIFILPVIALILLVIASSCRKISSYFEKLDDEEYESTNYYKEHCEGKEQ